MNSTITDIRGGAGHRAGEGHFTGHAVNDNDAMGAAANAANGARKQAKPELTKEEKRIQAAEGARGWLMMPWMLEFGIMLRGAVKGFFHLFKWTRGQVIFDALIINPLKALKETPISQILHLRGNYVEARAESVLEANKDAVRIGAKLDVHKATAKATALAEKATSLKASAKAGGTAIASNRFITGIRKSGGNAIDSFARTGVGQSIEKGLKGFFQGRHEKLTAKHASKIEAAQKAFTTEAPGMFGFLKGGAAKTVVEVGEHLQPHMEKLEALHANTSLPHAERVSGLEGVLKDLTKFTQETGSKGDKVFVAAQQRAGGVIKHLEDALHHAKGAALYHPENTTGLRGMAKGLLVGIGKVPVFHALIAAGTVTGLAVVAMNANKEKHEAKEAYEQMTADLGGNTNSPYLQNVQKAYKQQKRDGFIKAGAGAISEASNIGFLALPGGAGMAMMAPQMLPAVLPMFIKENEMLNAYAALKQEEKGKIQLEPAQKLQLVKHLVAGLPSVEAHGGVYNMLVTPVAEEIMNRKLSVKDTLRLINNDSEFTAIATAAAEKQKAALDAAKAAKTPHAKMPETAAANPVPKTPEAVSPTNDAALTNAAIAADVNAAAITATPQLSAKQSAEAAYMAAEKPQSAKVSVADKALEGKIDESQLAVVNA